MSDIFISYAREDKPRAQVLAETLEQQGWSVWWDPNIRIGGKFDQIIKRELDAAKCVIVLWSEASLRSDWVKDEACEAAKRGILVPVLIDDVEIPFGFGFRRIQTAWLVDWRGSLSDPEFTRVVKDISTLIGIASSKTLATQSPSASAAKVSPIHRASPSTSKLLEPSTKPDARDRKRKRYEIGAVLLLVAVIFSIAYVSAKRAQTNKTSEAAEPKNDFVQVTAYKLYWQMSQDEQVNFIQARALYISKMLGADPQKLDRDSVALIKQELDDYVAGKDSLSPETFEEGLRPLYSRATLYAPYITQTFNERRVPPIIGLYVAMIESEYRPCSSPVPLKGQGLFGFSPKTSLKYGIALNDRCDPQKTSRAAAHYIDDLIGEFGLDSSSVTLAILSYNIGEDNVRKDLHLLLNNGIKGRDFWSLASHADKLDEVFQKKQIQYVPRFFAAAIIGETPEAFDLQLQPLSTYTQINKRTDFDSIFEPSR